MARTITIVSRQQYERLQNEFAPEECVDGRSQDRLTAMTEMLPVVKTGCGSNYVKAGEGERPVLVGGSRSKPVDPAD